MLNKNRTIVLLVCVILAIAAYYAVRCYLPATKSVSKIVYIEPTDDDSMNLVVSNNDKDRTDKKYLFKYRGFAGVQDNGLIYWRSGAFIRDGFLYYCDPVKQALCSYDLKTGGEQILLEKAIFPFMIEFGADNDCLIVYLSPENVGDHDFPAHSFMIYYAQTGARKELPLQIKSGFVSCPRKVIGQEYVLFDTARYETECQSYYQLVSLDGAKPFKLEQIYLFAAHQDKFAYLTTREDSIALMRLSVNDLNILDLKTQKSRQLYYDKKIDIYGLAFDRSGRFLEMSGEQAIAKGPSEEKPFITKEISLLYDLQTDKVSQGKLADNDRQPQLAGIDLNTDYDGVIGVYKP